MLLITFEVELLFAVVALLNIFVITSSPVLLSKHHVNLVFRKVYDATLENNHDVCIM